MKWELEDLSLKYLDPDGYREIITYLDSKADVLNEFMSDVKKKITDRLTEYSIHATVQSRIKHTYSIYRKMYTQKRGLDEIFDLCAFRVIVDDIPDCYNVLGHIHDMFRPVPGRFKDYIATPKPNGYQSVHTTVLGEEGIMFEVQIRTWEMHETAEYGTASANTASPRTGSTNPAARASAPEMRRSSPGSAACSKRSRTPTRRTSFTISKWTCSTTRFSYSRRRATW